GGLRDRRGGHLHPLNLALGEARASESLGGKICENSRVVRVDKNGKPRVYTEKGSVSAEYAVVCGNAYLTGILPEITGRIMPVSSQIVTTEPLGEELAKKMMPAGACVEDCNFLLDYYRITADHRLLFGGGAIYSGFEPEDVIRRLKPHLLRTFPYLKDKKIDFAWNGQFAITLTRFPHLGRLSDTVYFIQGDSGHGVTACHLQGKLVAEAINHQAARFDVFARIRNYPFPGGRLFRVPLTALGAWYYELREVIGI
ncbi:MAG: FAD-binding oxidoreductase, partial [Alphaproteobacteria bacterium]|nr:FAD-binding oxidoreductase [Alphaproteobacteria bacterium]